MSNIRIPLVAAMTLSLCALALPVRAGNNDEENKQDDNKSSHPAYLSLGDSVPFGLNPALDINLNNYVGFPTIVGQIRHAPVTNAACPFETTGSLLAPSASDPGCLRWTSAPINGPLFISHGSGSQMDLAVNFLQSNKVNLVTLMIGGNDLAQLLYVTCGGDATCAVAGLPGVLGTVGQNLATAFSRIRATGYKGPIVAVNYYGFNYHDPLTTGAFQALNQTIAAAAAPFKVKLADSFGAFAAASASSGGDTCAAGLLIKKAGGVVGGTCDNHPSLYGQTVLAGAVMAALGDDQDDQ